MARLRWSGSQAALREHLEAVAKNPPLRKRPQSKRKRGKKARRGGHQVFVVTPASYPTYLKTQHWKSTSARKRKASRYQCDSCGLKGYLEIHHKHYRTLWKESNTDLERLCRTCHQSRHGRPDSKS